MPKKTSAIKFLLLFSLVATPFLSTTASAQATTSGVTGTDPVPPAPGPKTAVASPSAGDLATAVLIFLGLA